MLIKLSEQLRIKFQLHMSILRMITKSMMRISFTVAQIQLNKAKQWMTSKYGSILVIEFFDTF